MLSSKLSLSYASVATHANLRGTQAVALADPSILAVPTIQLKPITVAVKKACSAAQARFSTLCHADR